MEIKIDIEMAQRIVILLAKYPYEEVADIIDFIKNQANNKIEK